MPDVFLSYKRERRPAAEHLAAILRLYGYDVWFDYALVKGRDFGLQIDRQIRSSAVLVVLWCRRSVASRWVHEEVDLAHDLGILVPAKIEPCELPVGNRRIDHVDLISWDGSPRSSKLDDVLVHIAKRVKRDPAPDFHGLRDYEATWKRFGSPPLVAFALEDSESEDEPASLEQKRGNRPKRIAFDGRDLDVLRDIWIELRTSESVDRLTRFLEQVRGTPLDLLVEERLAAIERTASSPKTADWLREARPILERIRHLYESMGWKQGATASDPRTFGDNLRALVLLLPPVNLETDVVRASNVFNEYLNTKIHHGQPIPDDYTLEAVFPLPGAQWGESLDRVAICRRPGVKSSEYIREGFGGIGTGLLVEPEVEFRKT